MKYGLIGSFIKLAFARTAFDYVEWEIPSIDPEPYQKRVLKKYREIVERTPGIGSMKDNMFVMTLYAGAFLIALYQEAEGKMDEEKLKGLVRACATCPLMVKAKQGKSAFTEKEIAARTRQSKWSRDHIEEYPMNWYYYFETVPGKEEYYITHKQCGICKLTAQEHCPEITKYLCMMDYYTFEMQGAVLDRTKTLGYGDDECNFHLMSRDRARELGFVKSPDAKQGGEADDERPARSRTQKRADPKRTPFCHQEEKNEGSFPEALYSLPGKILRLYAEENGK